MKNNYVSIDIKNDKKGSNSVYGRHALRIAIVFAALVLMAGSACAATLTVDDSGGADYARIQDAIDNASANDTWSVTRNGTIVEISYGSDTNFPQYAALHIDSGYFRMVASDTNWGTSVILLPSFWENGIYYQGAPVIYEWYVEGSDLILLLSGNISNLTANAKMRIFPPTDDTILANVEGNVTGNVELDNRTGEAFKPVMLSSMHVSSDMWDAYSAYADHTKFSIPDEGWIVWAPVNSSIFGLKGGSSEWKNNAPTVEIHLNESFEITGWVTNSGNPNDDDVGFWAASSDITRTWNYTIEARKEPSNVSNIIYVPDNYTKIQWAIDNATAGDTIIVKSGTYFENVNVTKQLTLRGIDTGGGKPVVNANRNGSAIMLTAEGCTLEGFNATNSTGEDYAGINISASNNIIKNNNASNNEFGILLKFSSNNMLNGNNVSKNGIGIALVVSDNNMLSGNNALDNTYGISLIISGNNTLTNNKMSRNKYNFDFVIFENMFKLNNSIYINNLADEKPIYYLEGASNAVFNSSTNAGTFYCISCFNVTVEGLNLNNNGNGIVFLNSTKSKIQNVNISNNGYGIYLDSSSSNNTLSGNIASNNRDGIYLYGSSNNMLNNNHVSNNTRGIYLYIGNNNILIDNNATQNKGNGIEFLESSDNTLIGNRVSKNFGGISLHSARNSTLLNNIMTENKYNFGLYGNFDNEIDTSNLVDGKPIYYLKGAENTVFDSSTNAGTFYCISCENVTIKDMKFSNNGAGVFFWNTTISRIQNITAINNTDGISLYSSKNNMLISNDASNNVNGIYIESSNNNTIYNNFFNNTDNLDIRNSVNNWNNTKTSGTNIIGGPCLGGNVWANPNSTGFSQTCIDTDSDEICDSPYEIDSSNIDYMPLAYNRSSSAQLKGDVSGDGQVSVVDALFIAQYTVGTRALTSTQLAAADVNGDGQVTIVDALFIAQYTVGLRQL